MWLVASLERHGLLIGLILILVVFGWAVLLARKAARNVESFREEQHERFGAPQIK